MFQRFSMGLVVIGVSTVAAWAQVTPSTIREATAAGPEGNAQAGIQATVDTFRADLGDPNNGNSVGNQGPGRRQITWDGGDDDAAPARLPANFFNAIAPRGAIFDTDPRIQFQVSADAANATTTPIEFGNVNADYPTAFSTFSSPRLFTALNTNVMEVDFFVPGTLDPAVVTGFGAVFTDVDIADITKMEYFDVEGNLLFTRSVLATSGNESLSFLGVTFDEAIVRRVRITSGTAALGDDDVTQGGTVDLVVLDDFIYGEPVAVPDTDDDGTLDPDDGCPEDANKTSPGACGCGDSDDDADADGVPDCFDVCPGEDDVVDADADGTPDCRDGCPDDADKTSPGACGCGESEADADSDGVADCIDECPGTNDAADADGDGTPDCLEDCPSDANKTDPGVCGCGVSDQDSDNDTVPNCFDLCAGEDDRTDANTDGIPDCLVDPDDDNGASGCAPGLLPITAMLVPAFLMLRGTRRHRGGRRTLQT